MHSIQSPKKPPRHGCVPGVACPPGKVCCDGEPPCMHPWQCVNYASTHAGVVDELGGVLDLLGFCPPGQSYNISTLQCEPDDGAPPVDGDDPGGDPGTCPPGMTGTPPFCISVEPPWPTPPVLPPGDLPGDIPTVTEAECASRVEAESKKHVWYAAGAGVGGVLLGALGALLLK